MPDDPRVQDLLDELLDSDATPEDVCGSCVELLPVVRERWRRMCRARAELDAMFPPALDTRASLEAVMPENTPLPAIPGYDVEAVLGLGGMGIVFRARHLRLNRTVALKMALAGAYAGAHERQRFQREAEAVAALRHPNVVQVYDVGDSNGRPYFTMEFVEGGSLSQKLSGTPLAGRPAAQLLAALAVAVHAAHRSGIVHRDLKPANVLLTAEGAPKIGDFGLARRLGGEVGLTRTGAAVGTPSYMAPEQARGTADAAGPSVDVYALGAILYELLTGRPPFRAETAAETVNQVLSLDPVPPSRLNASVPRDLETICLKCLRKEPALRYASAAVLEDDLQRFLRGDAIAARPERRLERLVRRLRRRPAFSAAVGLSTLLTGALIGGGLWTLSDRAATARDARAKELAAELAADADLKDMADKLMKSAWPEARVAWERAKGRLGDHGSPDLRRRLARGESELRLVVRLDKILQSQSASVLVNSTSEEADAQYESTFRECAIGHVHESPEVVAVRVKESNVRSLLLAALDDWAVCAPEPRREWLLAVARGADEDAGGWRDRARDPNIWRDRNAFEAVVKDAPVGAPCVPLLLALERHLVDVGRDSIPFLIRIQRAHPGDFFINQRLGLMLSHTGRLEEAVRYFQTAVALQPDSFTSNNYLGTVLARLGRDVEAVEYYRRAGELVPDSPPQIYNLAKSLRKLGRFDEAFDRVRAAIARNPKAALLHTSLGEILQAKGRYDEAIAEHRQAVDLEPDDRFCRDVLRAVLKTQGRLAEAREIWGKALERRPKNHNEWYGYAEYCLFLGEEDEYRRGRKALLAQFGSTTDPSIAERTGRACLLRPASGDELAQATILADRAAAADRTKYSPGLICCFLFVKGLAEYRQGRFEAAISMMRGDASHVLGPAPRLVLAMALHQSRREAEARKTFVAAVLGHDWREDQVRDQDGWIYHALRREAEGMIIPQVPAFLEGKHQPRDNDERLALLGVCQFTNRSAAMARLYADAFAADPQLADNQANGHRFNAARAAGRAGCGQGVDAAKLNPDERTQWREQARQWMRTDLTAWSRAMASATKDNREWLRQRLMEWLREADLACLRDPAELAKLPVDERKDCLALWEDVGALLNRCNNKK